MTETPLFLSIIMCTRDRAASLSIVLDSACQMIVPEDVTYEFIIVDNGSTDATPALIESYTDRLPIRRAFEPAAGLSNARNCGVAATKGDYILWTDDDVRIDPDWLASYARAFRQYPNAALFAGRIIPVLEEPTPKWFVSNAHLLEDVPAVRDFGSEYLPLSLEGDRLPYGANYAVRGAEQRQFTYDPELGVGPGRRRVGEETALFRSLMNAGAEGVWVPDSKVYHIITVARQTTEYVARYCGGAGETVAFENQRSRVRSKFAALCYHGLRAGLHGAALYALRPLPPRFWLRRLKGLGYHAGALGYLRKHQEQ